MDGSEPANQNQHLSDQKENNLPWVIVAILLTLLIITVGIILYLLNEQNRNSKSVSDRSNSGISTPSLPTPTIIPSPTPAVRLINKQYSFPLRNASGETVSQLLFVVTNYERTNEVTIAGGKATTIEGKELVVINIELTNQFNRAIQINARDYLRLRVNEQEKLLAPEFHSDPVEIQPKSTKSVRMAFSINETDTNLILYVGELEGDKDQLVLETY